MDDAILSWNEIDTTSDFTIQDYAWLVKNPVNWRDSSVRITIRYMTDTRMNKIKMQIFSYATDWRLWIKRWRFSFLLTITDNSSVEIRCIEHYFLDSEENWPMAWQTASTIMDVNDTGWQKEGTASFPYRTVFCTIHPCGLLLRWLKRSAWCSLHSEVWREKL